LKSFLLQNKKTILVIFVLIVAVACLTKVLLEYQWRAIGEMLGKADFSLLIIGSSLSIISYWLCRAMRWQVLLKAENTNLPFWQVYLITAISVGSSTITPFQSGEALKVEYLRKHGAGRLSGYAIFFIERLFDLLTVVGLGILGILFGFDFGVPNSYFYIFAAVLIVFSLIGIGIIFVFPSERLNPVRILLREKRRQKRSIFLAALLTVFSWVMVILGWNAAMNSVSINVNFLQASSVVSLTTLLAIMSFVPGAVGVSEISITTILTKMEIALPLAQTGAIVIRAYALMIIFWTLLHWLIFKTYEKLKTGKVETL
jgi:uncharacterized membrane protein YbhN (UPF0104 family)